jgi:hypothetical protein
MTIHLASTEDVYLWLYRRLSKDWIVIGGDPDAIINLEYQVYTPGTFKNADLELVILSAFPLRSVMIGRKRPELRNMLKLGDDLEGWKSLYFLSLKPFGKLMALETMHLNPEVDKEHFMEDYVRKILGMPVEEDPQ